MAQISLILIGNCSIFDCEHDCEDDFEHEIVVRTFLDALRLGRVYVRAAAFGGSER